jgi:hypothetical protein
VPQVELSEHTNRLIREHLASAAPPLSAAPRGISRVRRAAG